MHHYQLLLALLIFLDLIVVKSVTGEGIPSTLNYVCDSSGCYWPITYRDYEYPVESDVTPSDLIKTDRNIEGHFRCSRDTRPYMLTQVNGARFNLGTESIYGAFKPYIEIGFFVFNSSHSQIIADFAGFLWYTEYSTSNTVRLKIDTFITLTTSQLFLALDDKSGEIRERQLPITEGPHTLIIAVSTNYYNNPLLVNMNVWLDGSSINIGGSKGPWPFVSNIVPSYTLMMNLIRYQDDACVGGLTVQSQGESRSFPTIAHCCNIIDYESIDSPLPFVENHLCGKVSCSLGINSTMTCSGCSTETVSQFALCTDSTLPFVKKDVPLCEIPRFRSLPSCVSIQYHKNSFNDTHWKFDLTASRNSFCDEDCGIDVVFEYTFKTQYKQFNLNISTPQPIYKGILVNDEPICLDVCCDHQPHLKLVPKLWLGSLTDFEEECLVGSGCFIDQTWSNAELTVVKGFDLVVKPDDLLNMIISNTKKCFRLSCTTAAIKTDDLSSCVGGCFEINQDQLTNKHSIAPNELTTCLMRVWPLWYPQAECASPIDRLATISLSFQEPPNTPTSKPTNLQVEPTNAGASLSTALLTLIILGLIACIGTLCLNIFGKVSKRLNLVYHELKLLNHGQGIIRKHSWTRMKPSQSVDENDISDWRDGAFSAIAKQENDKAGLLHKRTSSLFQVKEGYGQGN